jgi:hypothetical protein
MDIPKSSSCAALDRLYRGQNYPLPEAVGAFERQITIKYWLNDHGHVAASSCPVHRPVTDQ